jgi:hypothetical protein
VGGQDADPSRYPYFVRLDFDGEFGCGGSLIHSDFVLTAAHCAFPQDLGSLTVAFLDNTTGNASSTAISRTVTQIIQHHIYDDWSEAHDVALLRIDPPAPDNIPLLQYSQDRSALQPGDLLTVIGVGSTVGTDHGGSADVLQEVQVPVVDDSACDPLYEDTLHRKAMLCAGGVEGKDSCSGDSGGPLLVLGPDGPASDVQVGVVSFGGHRCGDASQPGVYAEVAYVADWIESILCQQSTFPPPGCRVSVDFSTDPLRWTANDTCRDFAGAFYTDWWHQFRRCDWLREKSRTSLYCEPDQEAWVQCPLTCHACTYEIDEDQLDLIDGDVDDLSFDEYSKPIALVFVFIFSCVFCCQITFFLWTKLRPNKKKEPASLAKGDVSIVVVPADP